MCAAASNIGRYAAVFYQVGVAFVSGDSTNNSRCMYSARNIPCYVQVLDGSSVEFIERCGAVAAREVCGDGGSAAVEGPTETGIGIASCTIIYVNVLCQQEILSAI